jgi:hypothetical protein
VIVTQFACGKPGLLGREATETSLDFHGTKLTIRPFDRRTLMAMAPGCNSRPESTAVIIPIICRRRSQ